MSDERLDEETELAIGVVFRSQAGHARAVLGDPANCEGCINALNALRSRIRFLIEEARKEGQSEQAAAMADYPDV